MMLATLSCAWADAPKNNRGNESNSNLKNPAATMDPLRGCEAGAGEEVDVDCTGGTIALAGNQKLDQPGVKTFTLWTIFIIFLAGSLWPMHAADDFSSARKLEEAPASSQSRKA